MSNVKSHNMHQITRKAVQAIALVAAWLAGNAGAGVLDKFGGTWDTVPIYRGGCESDAHHHTIEVSADKQRVTFKFLKPIQGPNGLTQQSIYKVLYEEDDRVALYLEGEARRQANGDHPIWVLILERPNYYRWRVYGTPADARNTVTGMRCKD
jgi:hypothetical protein